jgi:hypothetical protein
VLLAAAGLAIGVVGYRFAHRARPRPDLSALPAAPVLNSPAAASPSAEPAPAPELTAVHEPATSTTAADFPAAPPPPLDTPPPALSASAAAPSDAPAPGSQRITINTTPPKAKFFHFGKEVGTAPFVIDLPPGEKRAYEVWLPGHITRKVLVDGSKPEIMLGLREEPKH